MICVRLQTPCQNKARLSLHCFEATRTHRAVLKGISAKVEPRVSLGWTHTARVRLHEPTGNIQLE